MEMPLTYFWQQPHNPMADRFNDLMQKDIGERKEVYAYAAALFVYRGDAPFKKIPYHIKYQGDISAGRYFGEMLGRKLVSCPHFKDVGIIIPVPLHRLRRLKRGYNQAEMLARGMSDVTGLPVVNLLKRTKNRKSQTHLSGEERRKNAEGIYCASVPDEWCGKRLVLVDDVMTTGATLANCALALEKADRNAEICIFPLCYAE